MVLVVFIYQKVAFIDEGFCSLLIYIIIIMQAVENLTYEISDLIRTLKYGIDALYNSFNGFEHHILILQVL